MKTGVYYSNNDIRIEERDIPKINDGEILMKTRACGICGTDLLEWYRKPKAPIILGHEACGEIVESKSKDYKQGMRIFASHHIPCNKCYYCLNGHHTSCEMLQVTNYDPGGFSEYIRLSRMNVDFGIYPLSDDISFEEGTLIEPLACVIRAQNLAKLEFKKSLLVIGCGVSGLLHIALAKMKGLFVAGMDINEYRLNFAKKFKADTKFSSEKKFDCVILCSGNASAIDRAFSSIDRGGIIVFFAVPSPSENVYFPITNLWRNEITIITSYGAAPKDLQDALKVIKMIGVKEMITHRFHLSKIQDGFSVVQQQGESIKVIIAL
ncbi:MAG: alcohol dehydrogenase catalytic domain-containing protein [bacterium]